MPDYVYRCTCGKTTERRERMLYGTAVICDCGCHMWRVPQAQRVNWGGAWPSEMHPNMREVVEGAEQRREETVPHVAG